MKRSLLPVAFLLIQACEGGDALSELPLPASPSPIVRGSLKSSEGIAFNSDGRLFVTGDKALWEVDYSGTLRKIASLTAPIGIAHDGQGSILVADAGPVTGPGFNLPMDGSILSVTPDGEVSTRATGIPDPNFILARNDGSLLVSDDFADIIYEVAAHGGEATEYLRGIIAPNGMALSPDGGTLYVAQTFAAIGTLEPDSRVWRVPLDPAGTPGVPVVLATLPTGATNDGVAVDEKGRVYVAANLAGEIYRVDPGTGAYERVAGEMFGVASLAFSRGNRFPEGSLFATQLFGGSVFEIPLGVRGAAIP